MKMKLPTLILGIFALPFLGMAGGPELAPPCKANIPLMKGPDGKPIWLKSTQLLEQASHCEAPRFPPIFKTARIEGTVILSILVDEKGEPHCIHVITGHPMCVGSAIDAAKKWKFKPMTQGGKPVGFYSLLEFHFSTGNADAKANSCLEAHW